MMAGGGHRASQRGVNATRGALCVCSGMPHTPKCRLMRWAAKHAREAFKMKRKVERKPLRPGARILLAALKAGPIKVTRLWELCGPGFSTRLSEIRAAGHRVTYDRQWKLYRLEQEESK